MQVQTNSNKHFIYFISSVKQSHYYGHKLYPILSVSRETESTSGEEANKEALAKSIRREVAKLSDKWSSLLGQLEGWQRRLDDTLPVKL